MRKLSKTDSDKHVGAKNKRSEKPQPTSWSAGLKAAAVGYLAPGASGVAGQGGLPSQCRFTYQPPFVDCAFPPCYCDALWETGVMNYAQSVGNNRCEELVPGNNLCGYMARDSMKQFFVAARRQCAWEDSVCIDSVFHLL